MYGYILIAALLGQSYEWVSREPTKYDWIETSPNSRGAIDVRPTTLVPSAVVYYFPDPKCPECTQHDILEFEKHSINYHVQLAPAWNTKKLPVIWWQDKATQQWLHDSYKSSVSQVQRALGLVVSAPPPESSVGFDSSQKAILSVPPVVTQPNVTTGGFYPTRGGNWTFPGSGRNALISHLQSGEHRGKFSRNFLESLSYSELKSLHSDDHEGRVKWAYVNGKAKSKSQPQQQVARREKRWVTQRVNCPSCPGGYYLQRVYQ